MAQIVWSGRAIFLGLGLTLAVAGMGRAEGETAETVVATVNGTDITLGHMVALGQNLPEQYQQLADDVLFNGLLEQLIQQTALSQSMEGKLTRRDDIMLENDRRAYISGTALRSVVDGAVTDAAIQAAYDAKYTSASPATEYHASHILVADEQLAKDLKTQIDGGADFAELAKTNSSDGSAAGGGDLGWFGAGMMVKPFEDAVLTLKPGEVSAPVQTQFGWHLVKLLETREAQAPGLDEVRAEIVSELERAAIQAHLETLTAGAEITRAEGIDPALLRSQTLLGQ